MAASDVLVSPATVWYAPVGTALPNPSTMLAGATWTAPWKNLGYTLEPTNLTMNVTPFDLYVQQLTVPLRTIRTQVEVMLETVMGEFTADNLKLATDGTVVTTAAGSGASGRDEVTVLASKVDVSLFAFGIEGVRVTDTNARVPVRIFIPRGSAVMNGNVTFAKDAGIGIPLQLKAFADNTGVALIIHNVTALAV